MAKIVKIGDILVILPPISHFQARFGDFIANYAYICGGMKQTTKYKLDTTRLYVGVTLLLWVLFDSVLCTLCSFFLPSLPAVSVTAGIFAVILAVLVVIRFVRCRPLSQEDKEEGIWFQIRLMR